MFYRNVFARTLAVHWKTLRWPLAVLTVLAFVLPLLSVASGPGIINAMPDDLATRFWLRPVWETGDWNLLFPAFAVAAGTVVALGVWSWDHREEHVLALSLPLPRSRYVLVKYAAGAALLAVVTAGFLAGAVTAGLGLDLPEWLHAYPGRLTLKFFLGGLVAYSLIFAMAAGTVPTALRVVTGMAVLTGVIIVLATTPLLPMFFGPTVAELGLRMVDLLGHALGEWPGPFAVLGGDWSLIGV